MRSRKILAIVIVNAALAIVFGTTQNCGRVSIAEPVETVQSSLSVSVSSELVIPVVRNKVETFAVPTTSGSASIKEVSLNPETSLLEDVTNMGGTVKIDPLTWNITFTPSVGMIGSDRAVLYVTGSDDKQLAVSVLFAVTSQNEDALPNLNALVYGSTPDDRVYLDNKLKGYAPPGMSEIFYKWGRFSKNLWFNSASEIKTLPSLSYCNTGVDLATGLFKNGTDPATGKAINPGTYGNCVNNPEFVATSWVLLQSPERIYCAANAGVVTGFVSPLSFEYYKHETIVMSKATDDDTIGLVVAFVRDGAGVNHVLAAVRTQGGNQPSMGWGLVYYKDGAAFKVLKNLSVGGVYKNTLTTGDNLGWNSRMSKISVVRQGDKIVATASPWGLTESSLALSAASKIDIDLSDSSLGLTIFQGAKPYGYMTLSQLGSEYRNVNFSTGANETYVYDLQNKIVYEKQASGKYEQRKDLDAFTHIGTPRQVGNPDTGKIFKLESNKSYKLLN